jgi:hypothetical protein
MGIKLAACGLGFTAKGQRLREVRSVFLCHEDTKSLSLLSLRPVAEFFNRKGVKVARRTQWIKFAKNHGLWPA